MHSEYYRVLTEAAASGKTEIIKFFLEYESKPSMDEINYAFYESVKYGKLEIAKFFLEYGVDIHSSYEEALYLSVMNNKYDMVKFLLENGAKIYSGNDLPEDEADILEEAVGECYYDMVKLLLDNGPKSTI